jgi:(2Fe-2S) ferredoxin
MFPRPKYSMYMCQVKRPPNFPKPSCVREGREDLLPYLQEKIMQKELFQSVSVVPTGCLNRCQFGPVMIVEPGSYMYVDLTKEKIDEIIEKHILNGEVVEEYLIPSEFWSEPIDPKDL